jgi:hypothetical protein
VTKILANKSKFTTICKNALLVSTSLIGLSAGSAHAATAQNNVTIPTEQSSYYGMGAAQYNFDYSKGQIGAGAAYQQGITGAGQVVAVLDSGVDRNWPTIRSPATMP